MLKIRLHAALQITYLLAALKKMREEDPGAKAVVFSTWTSVLQVVDLALRDNSIATASLGLTGSHNHTAVNLKRTARAPGFGYLNA